MLKRILFLILLFPFSPPIFSETKILVGDKIVLLQDGWVCRNEDNESFREIEIDESNWQKILLPTFFAIKETLEKHVVWCRLHFKMLDTNKDVGIKLSNIINSYELFVNEKKIGGQGIISKEGKMITPNAKPYLYKIEKKDLKSDENLISIRIADSSKSVGFLEEPSIGNWELAERDFYLSIGKHFSLSIILLFLAIYHLALFIPNRKDISYFYFALICFCISIYLLAYNKLTYWIYPNFHFHYFCQHVPINLMNSFIPIFISKLFEIKMDFFSKTLTKIYLFIFLFSFISVFVGELKYYYRSYILFGNLTLMLFLVSVEIIRKARLAFLRNQVEAKIIALGSIAISFAMLLYLFKFFDLGIRNLYVMESFFVFIFSIAIAMAVKFRISQEKIIQREANYSLELENEVKLKTEELALINVSLENSNQLKDKLFSILSHDLRSPLQVLDNVIQLFEEKSITPKKMKVYLSDVSLNLKKNRFLLENLLNWSKSSLIDQALNIQSKNISHIVLETILFFDENIEQKKIKIINHFQKELICKFDENMIRIIIRNLFNNAIKFTPPNGTIEIGFEELENEYKIYIWDSGIGMTTSELELLKNSKPIHSKKGTANETGSGIGILICNEVLQKLNSKLEINTELNQGSRFSFNLKK